MFIDDALAYDALDNGELITKSTPSSETKGMWYEIYRLKDKVYAIGMSNVGMAFGEEISEDTISNYV